MKKLLSVIILLSSILTYAQDENDIQLIDVDSTWIKEIFKFPIKFAQDINFKGVEEARFPPKGWRDATHQNFWTYAFVWQINLNRKITEEELEINLQKYFDGLVGVGVVKTYDGYDASALFVEIESTETSSIFKGRIKTFDRFATNQPITLNVLVESYWCKKEKESLILFKFSPKAFQHKIWNKLKEVKLFENLCKD